MRGRAVLLALVFVPLTVIAAPPDAIPSTALTDITLEEALRKNSGEALLFVTFTIPAYDPCKEAKPAVWRDSRVVQWVEDHGTVIVVDLLKNDEPAKELDLRELPEHIVYREGLEIDRASGCLTPERFFAWTERISKNDTESARLADRVKVIEAGTTQPSAQERELLARSLVRHGRWNDAADQYLWLWQESGKNSDGADHFQETFTGETFRRLLENRSGSLAFSKVRDLIEDELKDESKRTWPKLMEWLMLNDRLHDDARTLSWIDRVKGDEDGKATIRRVGLFVDELLIRHKRWEDLAVLYPNPNVFISMDAVLLDEFNRVGWIGGDNPAAEAHLQPLRQRFIDKATGMYIALFVTGHHEKTETFAARVLKTVNTPEARIALVTAALDAGHAHESMRKLLNEASEKGADVKSLVQRLDAMLKSK